MTGDEKAKGQQHQRQTDFKEQRYNRATQAEDEPQKDTTIEVGLDFGLGKKLDVSVVYFNREQDNYIDYVVTDFITYDGQ